RREVQNHVRLRIAQKTANRVPVHEIVLSRAGNEDFRSTTVAQLFDDEAAEESRSARDEHPFRLPIAHANGFRLNEGVAVLHENVREIAPGSASLEAAAPRSGPSRIALSGLGGAHRRLVVLGARLPRLRMLRVIGLVA